MLKVSVQCQIRGDSREWVKKQQADICIYVCMNEFMYVCMNALMYVYVYPWLQM